jgi:hypothetical protein
MERHSTILKIIVFTIQHELVLLALIQVRTTNVSTIGKCVYSNKELVIDTTLTW